MMTLAQKKPLRITSLKLIGEECIGPWCECLCCGGDDCVACIFLLDGSHGYLCQTCAEMALASAGDEP